MLLLSVVSGIVSFSAFRCSGRFVSFHVFQLFTGA